MPVKYLRGAPRDILQLIVQDGSVRWGDAGELTGWSGGSTVLTRLKMAGLVERKVGRWWATEKGKIALAIAMGQERKRQIQLSEMGRRSAEDRSVRRV